MKKLLAFVLTMVLAASLVPLASAEEPVTLRWILYTTDYEPKDQAMVAEALNKMSAEDIGIVVDFEYVTRDKVDLMMQSGEYWDMAYTSITFNDYVTHSHDGLFYDITDIVAEKAPKLYSYIPEMLWDATSVNGRNHSVPILKDYAIELFWRFDPAFFVDELGMEIPETMSYADVEPFLAAYKEKHPDEYPLYISRGGVTSNEYWLNWLLKDVLICTEFPKEPGDPNATTVKLALEIDKFVDNYRLVHSWFEKGYIQPDAATTSSIPAGQYSPVLSGQGWRGAEKIWEGVVGYGQQISRYEGPFLSTASAQSAMTAISAGTKYIDECLKYIEYINTDVEYRTMMRYGIEGVHYNMNADGTVTRTQQGTEKYNPLPYTQASYEVGPLEGEGTDPQMWTKVFEGYKDAVVSSTMGFSFNKTDVEMEVAACLAIWNNYNSELRSGTSDPDVVVPQIIAELEDAGIRDVIAECQRQLDEFLGK